MLDVYKNSIIVIIADFYHFVKQNLVTSNFFDLNFLKFDFILVNKIDLILNNFLKIVKLYFNEQFKVVKPTKL